jgi:DNA-binding Lrp family transcriptional regulator
MKELDNKILEILKKDSRTPFLQIAKKLNVSEGTVRNRVSKLIKEGVIKKFTIELETETTAIIEIITNPNVATKNIVAEIKKLNVTKLYEVAGRFTILGILETKNLEEANDLIEKIRAIKGVMQTETFPVLKKD